MLIKKIYNYKGYNNFLSKCGLRILNKHDNKEKYIVIFTELIDNSGTSITNCIEKLATNIYNEVFSNVNIENITWLEHYPKNGKIDASLDIVTFDFKDGIFSKPSWKRCSHQYFTEEIC